MRYTRWGLAVFMVSWLLGVPAAEGRAVRGPDRAQGATVVINEVQYDPPTAGSETAYEWLELYNTGGQPQDVSGWQLADARAATPLPDVVIAAGELVVVAAGEGFAELYPGFTGRVVVLGARIGNGLGNTGDQVRLLDPDGTEVDGLSYGDDAGVLDPPAPDVPAGHSLARVPAGADTDTAADWYDQPVPSPGAAEASAPTPTATMAPPPTVPAGVRVVLNEHLPAPKDIDWDGDGQVTTADEWVELYNSADVSTDIRGWQLDDVADGGSAPYVLPEGAVIPPRGYLVVFGSESKLQLNNGGDSVRLLAPDGSLVDETEYTKSTPDGAYARLTDGDGPWTDSLPPSPGQANGGAAPTATPPGGGPSPTSPPIASPTAGTPAQGTATAEPGRPAPAYLPLLLSEVLADPLVAGDDAAWEWVEVYNRTDGAVSLAGWWLGDAVAWDALPPAVVPPRGFAVVVGRSVSPTLVAPDAVVVPVPDGRIGNGLANQGDVVRLRGPTGRLADAVSYGRNLDAFDPAVPLGPPGSSLERIPPEVDSDTADDWWLQPAPSPGWAGAAPTGGPRVKLNEVLPAPRAVDWDGDGAAGYLDEWIELVNLAHYPESLAGWRLVAGGPDGWWYELPAGTRIAAGEHLVLGRAATGLALVNGGDEVRLVRPDGVVADVVSWSASPGYDRSLGRLPDGDGAWVAGLAATPGGPNRAPLAARPAGESAPEPAAEVTAAEARALAAGTRVALRGRVLVPAGRFGARTSYVGDEEAGLRVYLTGPDPALPVLAVGTQVLATGRLGNYRGEWQIILERAQDLWPAAAGEPVAPLPAATGDLGEALEGRLVVLEGAVLAASRSGLTLDDGSGPARVAVLLATGIRRPAARAGQWLRVVGLGSQSASRSPWQGGYRLLPREPADVQLAAKATRWRPAPPIVGIARRRAAGHGPAFGPVAYF